MLWLRAMGLPVLSGVVIPEWSAEAAALIRGFCRQNAFSDLLLRIDKPGQRWTTRRGGYIVSAHNARRVVDQLSKEGMIAILLEPASPYMDHYSLGALAIPDEGKIVLEVVGPGFDASDILRSDLQPHERFEVVLPPNRQRPNSTGGLDIERTFLIDSLSYEKTLEQRLAKIGARLEDPAYPDTRLDSPQADRKRLIDHALKFLAKNRENLLLKNMHAYKAIPQGYVVRFSRAVLKLLDGLAAYGIHLGTTSISASFIDQRRLVFWDFFPAKMRHTTGLIPTRQP
jgi:hypothetical protein